MKKNKKLFGRILYFILAITSLMVFSIFNLRTKKHEPVKKNV